MAELRSIQCDMDNACTAPATYIDDKGFAYCAPHGRSRSTDGYHRCRKLRPHELRKLQRGETLAHY